MNKAKPSPRWGMVIDINRCVGCQTCTTACKHANDTTPGVQWRGVLDIENGSFPDVQRAFLVVGCQHCAKPPCVPVCPTGATLQREDGLVTMDYDLCIGCGYCAVACPYQARTIVHEKDWYFGIETVQEQAVAHDERLGVAQKCSFCIERLDEGIELGRAPGVDLDATPVCAASCIAEAITFGDFNDPQSNVSRLTSDNANFQMHAELGTDPQIKYLYELPGNPGRDPTPQDLSDEVLSDPANPLVGQKQTFWDYRAAMNFILGGMGSGLAFLAMLAYFFMGLSDDGLLALFTFAGVLMTIGLCFVFMEISRKLRFIYVLLRPQSSWMTRETYFVALFYPALLADLIWPDVYLHGTVGITALGFLLCQARILYASKGIPAWRAPIMPWLIVASGLLEGIGLFALVHLFAPDKIPFAQSSTTLATMLSIVTGGLWIGYRLSAKRQGFPPLARRALNKVAPLVNILGHMLPLVGFAGLVNTQPGSFTLTLMAGCGAVLGGVIWKFTVITRASYQQGFALPKLPQRGSGSRAAPLRPSTYVSE